MKVAPLKTNMHYVEQVRRSQGWYGGAGSGHHGHFKPALHPVRHYRRSRFRRQSEAAMARQLVGSLLPCLMSPDFEIPSNKPCQVERPCSDKAAHKSVNRMTYGERTLHTNRMRRNFI